ncbi:hypothetical protein EVAR_92450_1 [Eumeta japonica]|uniref:Uncharacterized protein n=1 Tax=Eumeta variegata TaxID=151549 RepID=A0A4C1T6T2_EUMVA|nr:hypothetical protein EVAR_92450_1 [Eumeta japonica]
MRDNKPISALKLLNAADRKLVARRTSDVRRYEAEQFFQGSVTSLRDSNPAEGARAGASPLRGPLVGISDPLARVYFVQRSRNDRVQVRILEVY